MDKHNISGQILSNKNSPEVIDHTFDDNENNLLNTEEEAAVTFIHSITIDDGKFIHKDYAPF